VATEGAGSTRADPSNAPAAQLFLRRDNRPTNTVAVGGTGAPAIQSLPHPNEHSKGAHRTSHTWRQQLTYYCGFERDWQGERALAGERRMWDDDSMPKRNLRIIKRVRNIPVRGICELCNAQFYYEPHPHSQQSESQAALQQQFNAHQCKVESDTADTLTPKEEKA
jgi:hypothetical protein